MTALGSGTNSSSLNKASKSSRDKARSNRSVGRRSS
jgi:hypothetical protein